MGHIWRWSIASFDLGPPAPPPFFTYWDQITSLAESRHKESLLIPGVNEEGAGRLSLSRNRSRVRSRCKCSPGFMLCTHTLTLASDWEEKRQRLPSLQSDDEWFQGSFHSHNLVYIQKCLSLVWPGGTMIMSFLITYADMPLSQSQLKNVWLCDHRVWPYCLHVWSLLHCSSEACVFCLPTQHEDNDDVWRDVPRLFFFLTNFPSMLLPTVSDIHVDFDFVSFNSWKFSRSTKFAFIFPTLSSMLIWLICPHLGLFHFPIHKSFRISDYFILLFWTSFNPSPFNVQPSLPLLICFTSVLFLISFAVSPFDPCVSLINPSYPSLAIYSFYPCPSASAYFHIPELIPLSPRFQPVVFPVSLLIRLSLALVLLIPEGFVYLCWSCFYSLRLTPPIFSPVIWTAGLLCSYSTN